MSISRRPLIRWTGAPSGSSCVARHGIPPKVFDIVAALYTDSESAVRFGGGTSRFFPVKSGVRQGCVLVPTLFNACMDCVMGGVVAAGPCGASIGTSMITDLDFADDVVIFAETLELLVGALELFSGECTPRAYKYSGSRPRSRFLAIGFQKRVNSGGLAAGHRWETRQALTRRFNTIQPLKVARKSVPTLVRSGRKGVIWF